MKKRMIALALALVLALGCLIIPTSAGETPSRLRTIRKMSMTKDFPFENAYVYPYSASLFPATVKGGSFLMQFKRNIGTPRKDDIFFLEIYHCTVEQLLDESYYPELVEVREYSMSEFDNQLEALGTTWTADSRYTAGNYSYICGVCSAKGEVYEQDVCFSEMFVVNAPVAVTDINFKNGSESMFTGDTQIMALYPLPENATSRQPITAVSADPRILTATIDDAGYLILKGVGVGLTTVTVQCGSIKKVCEYYVNGISGFIATPGKTTLCVGETDTIKATVIPTQPDLYVQYEWFSYNPNVATVKDGVVTAVKPGIATITVSIPNPYNAFHESVTYTVNYHDLPKDTPVSNCTATQPKQSIGHCSVCGKDEAVNIYEPAIFTDTAAGAWYAPHVDLVYDRKLMNGTGAHSFSPDMPLSRAMAATVLYRIAGSPEVSGECPFDDVPAGQWYTDAVIWAQAQDVVTGYPDGLYHPDANITREQFATILCRYTKQLDPSTEAKGDLSSFPDGDRTAEYAREAVAWAVDTGLINGTVTGGQTYLKPHDNATRAQFATIISRYLDVLETLTPDPDKSENPGETNPEDPESTT